MRALLFSPIGFWKVSENFSDLHWIADQLRLLSRKVDRIAHSNESTIALPVRSPETALTIASKKERPFRYSPCFRSVQIDHQLFHLTSQQAEIIRTLYANWMQGTPDVSVAYLLESLSDQGFTATRLKDLFQKDKVAFRELIQPGVRRGTVRLRLENRR